VTSPRHTLSTERPLALRLRRAPALRSRSARGDAAAFAALYQRHHQELYRYCRAILRDDHDAQDALQSAMAKAFAALQNETRDFELRPWLFRIAHNEAISIVRRRPDAMGLDAAAETGVDSLPGTVDGRQRLADLRADLADLPERQRSALVLRELSGLGHEEIATVLSSSARAVKQAIFEARTGLHECAEGRDMACDEVQRALSDADGRVLRGRRIRAHLRSCRSCREFRTAMQTRPADLQALAAPLPVAAGSAVLAAVLPAGQATIAGSAGPAAAGGAVAAGAGSAGAGGAVAGAGSAAGGGALAGLATKAAIVATVGAVAVGAAKMDGTPGGRESGRQTPTAGSTHAPAAPAGPGAATSARRSGSPAAAPPVHAAPAGAAAPTALSPPARAKVGSRGQRSATTARARSGTPHGKRAKTRGRSGASRGRSGTAPGHARTAPARGPKRAHKAKPGRRAAAAGRGRAAPPGRRARPRRAASVGRRGPTVARPAARSPRPRPAPARRSAPRQRPAPARHPAPRATRPRRPSPPARSRATGGPRKAPGHAHAAAAPHPAPSAPPAANPGGGASAAAPGHAK
jgi:RNA polymerase sigma factor (sigma-70 family)